MEYWGVNNMVVTYIVIVSIITIIVFSIIGFICGVIRTIKCIENKVDMGVPIAHWNDDKSFYVLSEEEHIKYCHWSYTPKENLIKELQKQPDDRT